MKLVRGNLYYAPLHRGWLIEFDCMDGPKVMCQGYINVGDEYYYKESNYWGSMEDMGDFRSANAEELAWYNECKKNNKFVPLSSIVFDKIVNDYLIY